jgi:RimJ/RimL family protein N-acetyltransferase
MACDPQVMEFLLPLPTRADSDAWPTRAGAHRRERLGLLGRGGQGLGRIHRLHGAQRAAGALPFSPCVEIGWRLARHAWGQGFATEAARGALQVGFERLGLDEIVAFTAVGNLRSAAVMDRIGMHEDVAGAFDHPLVPEGHPLRRHRLYRIGRAGGMVQPAWARATRLRMNAAAAPRPRRSRRPARRSAARAR